MSQRKKWGHSRPSPEWQKEVIRQLLNQKLVIGDTWYLIDVRWMKQWKKYTGYEKWCQPSSECFPGLLQTKNLFSECGTELKEHLREELDYSLVPQKAWEHLLEWYGLSNDSKPIARKVVEYGLYMKHCKVEVYLLRFKLSLHPKLSEHTTKEFSRSNTVADLEVAMRRVYAIPVETPCRVWHRYMSHTYELLLDPSQTLQDAGLQNMQTIVIEKRNSDGTWPRGMQHINPAYATEQENVHETQEKEEDSYSQHTMEESVKTEAKNDEMIAKSPPSTPVKRKIYKTAESLPVGAASPEEVDDWLSTQQKSQHDELVESVAYEQNRANKASQRAQDALNRLAQRESQLQSVNKSLENVEMLLTKQKDKTAEEERRASEAEQTVAQLQSQLQQVTMSLKVAEQEKDAAHERVSRAEESIRQLETQRDEIALRKKVTEEIFEILETELRNIQQQQQTQLQASQQQLQDTEQRLQQAHQRADQQQERATLAETRLQHSDQMFQDIFQRLIGQLPQSQPQWVVQRDEIELSAEEIGVGGWATVKVGTFRGNRVAAKCLHRQIVSAHNVRIFTREMNMAANARHPNLLQFIGATLDSQEPIILTELMPTSLCRVMEEGTRLSHPQITSVSRQVALALNYLHLTQPEAIIHRDVSSSNILLEPLQFGWKAKLSDYGSANFVRHTTTAGPGNPTYAAPEAVNPQQQSTKMDVFSFGVLLLEMCAGELAPKEERDRLLASVQWPAMVAQIRACLRHEPQRRPDIVTLITQMDQL